MNRQLKFLLYLNVLSADNSKRKPFKGNILTGNVIETFNFSRIFALLCDRYIKWCYITSLLLVLY